MRSKNGPWKHEKRQMGAKGTRLQYTIKIVIDISKRNKLERLRGNTKEAQFDGNEWPHFAKLKQPRTDTPKRPEQALWQCRQRPGAQNRLRNDRTTGSGSALGETESTGRELVTAGTGVPMDGIDHKKNGMGRYHPFATRQPQKHSRHYPLTTFTSQGGQHASCNNH